MKPFEFDDVFIGRTPDRARVFVDASWDGERLSLTGTVIDFGEHGATSVGQVTDEVRLVNPVLADLWDRWHLNDLRAGCEHQEHIFRLNPAARPTWKNDYKGSTGITLSPEPGSTCYECGYRYGSAWNTEEVPESVLVKIKAILSGETVCICDAPHDSCACPEHPTCQGQHMTVNNWDCETEAYSLSDCKHWDKPGTECSGPRVGITDDGVVLCEGHFNAVPQGA